MKTIIGSRIITAPRPQFPGSDNSPVIKENFHDVTVKLRLLGHALSKRSEPGFKPMSSKIQNMYKELDKMESQARKLLS